MTRYLVVANQTLAGEHLRARIRERIAAGPCAFHVLVPATAPSDHPWTEGEVHAVAEERLRRALDWIREAGAEATGEIGDPRPMEAVRDALRSGSFDGVMLSTLPPGVSRWLRQDLPHRVQRTFGIPVDHIVAAPEPAQR